MTDKHIFKYRLTSDDMANYFDVKDTKVKFNKDTKFWKLIEKYDTNFYTLDCYTESANEVSYNLYWRINDEQSDIDEKFNYKKYCDGWNKIGNINTSSAFAMCSCGWDIEEDTDNEN